MQLLSALQDAACCAADLPLMQTVSCGFTGSAFTVWSVDCVLYRTVFQFYSVEGRMVANHSCLPLTHFSISCRPFLHPLYHYRHIPSSLYCSILILLFQSLFLSDSSCSFAFLLIMPQNNTDNLIFAYSSLKMNTALLSVALNGMKYHLVEWNADTERLKFHWIIINHSFPTAQ